MIALKNLSRSAGAPREWFRDLLWRAFPARSDADRAKQIHRALGVSQRQAQNWLRCENDAALRHVVAVLAIAGAEVVFCRMGGRR